MLKIERHQMITDEITEKGFVLVSELSERIGCSEETVRRDLKELDSENKLIRTHGGAYLMDKYDKSYPTELKKVYQIGNKKKMAEAALKYLKDNDVIMMDSSTTCLTLCETFIESKLNLTIITNSLQICNLCAKEGSNINLVCTGGSYRARSASFTDSRSLNIINSNYADKAFISCPKVTVQYGLSDNHTSEAAVREAMLKHSKMKFLVLDHTKFDESANILFSGLEDIDVLLTDEELGDEWKMYMDEHGIIAEYV